MKNKKILLFLVVLPLLFLFSCKTTNEIHNETYDVNINISDINQAFVPASTKARTATVGVSLYTKSSLIRSWYLTATGSGVVYKGNAYLKNGTTISIEESQGHEDVDYYEYYVLTNAHVVNSNAKNKDIKIYLASIDTLVSSNLLGINAYEDLAVVKFSSSIYIKPLDFSETEPLVGEIVLASGNPLGYDYASTVTMGIISCSDRFLDVSRDTNGDGRDDWNGTVQVIQHDASINSGNSGGALVNVKGELVGINAMKVTDKEESVEGIGFAIPIKVISNVLEDMENGQDAKVNLITGAVIYNVNELINREVLNLTKLPVVDFTGISYTSGAYVYTNTKEEYGLKAGDIVLKINDNDIYTTGMLEAMLRSYKGSKLTWQVYRNGTLQEVEYIFK